MKKTATSGRHGVRLGLYRQTSRAKRPDGTDECARAILAFFHDPGLFALPVAFF